MTPNCDIKLKIGVIIGQLINNLSYVKYRDTKLNIYTVLANIVKSVNFETFVIKLYKYC